MIKYLSNIKHKNTILGILFSFLFIVLFTILIADNNFLKNENRVTDGYHEVFTMREECIEDDTTPQGIVRTFTTIMDDFDSNANCFAFYVIHQYVKVYIDGELVYTFYPEKDSSISDTLGCVWVIVPLTHNDNGKEFVVELTPVYSDGINADVRFFHGSQYDILLDILINNIVWVFISVASIIVGLVLIGGYIHSKLNRKASNHSLVYLGLVAILISIWKLFDLELAPLLFQENSRFLFYLSYVSLMLIPLPLIKYIQSLLKNKKSKAINFVFYAYSTLLYVFLVLQFFNFFDIRAYISIVLAIILAVMASLLFIVVLQGDFQSFKKNNFKELLPLFLVVLSTGGMLDIIIYLVVKTTDYLIFTFLAFFIYTLIIAVHSLSENDKRNYRDFQTGLYNANSCKEFLEEHSKMKDCCVMMIDLNGLKYTNDNYGHAAGDRLILDLTNILKKSIPMNDFVGRCGGDEFIAIIQNCDNSKIKRITESLEYYKRECNEDRMPKLSFAYGYALSSDYEGTLSDLLKIADEKMYVKKEEHYKNQ